MFFANMSDMVPWVIVILFVGNSALNRTFGLEWPKLLGDSIRAWWASRNMREGVGDESRQP